MLDKLKEDYDAIMDLVNKNGPTSRTVSRWSTDDVW